MLMEDFKAVNEKTQLHLGRLGWISGRIFLSKGDWPLEWSPWSGWREGRTGPQAVPG